MQNEFMSGQQRPAAKATRVGRQASPSVPAASEQKPSEEHPVQQQSSKHADDISGMPITMTCTHHKHAQEGVTWCTHVALSSQQSMDLSAHMPTECTVSVCRIAARHVGHTDRCTGEACQWTDHSSQCSSRRICIPQSYTQKAV